MEEKILVLKGLLEKAYKLETSFENETVFRAFLSELSDEQRKVLFELMSDSERHKIKIEKLARDLGFELEKSVEKLQFSDKMIFNEIYKIELSAKALYEYIASNFSKVLKEKTSVIEELAKDEERHAKLVEKFVDRIMRL